MKTVYQIAKECGLEPWSINYIILKEKIEVGFGYNHKNKLVKTINPTQENYIHKILYFEGKISEITLESKMNYDVHS